MRRLDRRSIRCKYLNLVAVLIGTDIIMSAAQCADLGMRTDGLHQELAERISPTISRLHAISCDDLVRRVQIPLAALSPDGHFAAYLLVRGDPLSDAYDVTVRVRDVTLGADPITVQEFQMTPEETFTELGWLAPSATNLRWIDSQTLLYVTKKGGSAQLVSWNVRSLQSRVLLDGHQRVEMQSSPSNHNEVLFDTIDSVERASAGPRIPMDFGWQIRDGYRFYRSLQNPSNGRRVRKQSWSVTSDSELTISTNGSYLDAWERTPDEMSGRYPEGSDPGSGIYLMNETPAPSGSLVAAEGLHYSNLTKPAESYPTFSIVLKNTGNTTDTKVLLPDTRRFVLLNTTIVGWNSRDSSVNYLYVGPNRTEMNNVTLEGNVSRLHSENSLLAKPCPALRRCQIASADGRFVLLTRSTNLVPAELVLADYQTGFVTLLESPNDTFLHATRPEVRFYEVGDTGAESWGRLYLPLNYRRGVRYPLVITQYSSSPGFAAATGDEIPILPLVAHGIAVFDMYSGALDQVTTKAAGDFRYELNRVQRPLKGMRWIADQLVAEKIVDPDRIAVAGLSYGAEIAMYAYWNWPQLRTVSAATAAWSPSQYLFGGPAYSESLDERGFPSASDTAMWQKLDAGLSANRNLPPLLFQSPDSEENSTVPTWTQLRRAGASVEWYEYPNEGHVKRRPANKWWVFERNLDWFRFWLKDEEDSNPTKREQYARWRALRGKRSP